MSAFLFSIIFSTVAVCNPQKPSPTPIPKTETVIAEDEEIVNDLEFFILLNQLEDLDDET